MTRIHRKFFSLFLIVLFLSCALTGCVRFSGGAGYWKTEADGETRSHQASFDTDRLLRPDQPRGSITV